MAERREQLLAAFDKVEGGEDDKADETTDGAGAADGAGDGVISAASASESGGDPADNGVDAGSDTKDESVLAGEKSASASKDASKTKSAKSVEPKSKGAEPVSAKSAASPEPVTDKPPQSAKRSIREGWDKLPADVRKDITERETEIASGLAGIQKTRAWENEFRETVTPYLSLIQAQNSTPMKAVKNLMHTAARLSLGTPNQKAAVVDEIIRNYGVDLKELNAVLEARIANPGTPQQGANFNPTEVPAWAKPMVDFVSAAQQSQQTHQQRVQQEAQREIQEFEAKPFWEDLKEDVGLLMHRANSRNVSLSLPEAYAQARKMNPEIDAKIKATETPTKAGGTPSVSQAASVLARARNAASSVKGAPVAPGSAGKANGKAAVPKTRREIISEQLDAAGGG